MASQALLRASIRIGRRTTAIGSELFGTVANIGSGSLKWNAGILFGLTSARRAKQSGGSSNTKFSSDPRRGAGLERRRYECRSYQVRRETATKEPRTTSSRSLTWTCRRFPIKTFAALVERNRGPCTGLRQPDDINAVEIIPLPIRHDGGIATMLGDEKAG
jgi:hypothetical protein